MASPRGCVAADRHPGPLHSEQTPPPSSPRLQLRSEIQTQPGEETRAKRVSWAPPAAGEVQTQRKAHAPRPTKCKAEVSGTTRRPLELARVRGRRAWAPAGDRGGPSRAQRPGRCPEKPFADVPRGPATPPAFGRNRGRRPYVKEVAMRLQTRAFAQSTRFKQH